MPFRIFFKKYVHCCQSSNLASVLFDGQKNTFQHFLTLFLRSLAASAKVSARR